MANGPTDYLALQVERLADAVESLSERLRVVEQKQGSAEAVEYERITRTAKWGWPQLFWRIIAGAAIALGTWLVKVIADHLTYVPGAK
jgi:hypothetical protein